MERLECIIDINAPHHTCYDRWHEFERFPTFMKYVNKVTRLDNNDYRWDVDTPISKTLSWNSRITSDQRDYSLSWVSLPPHQVEMRGSIRFNPMTPDTTRLVVSIDYALIHSSVLNVISHILPIAQDMVDEELENFKNWVEGHYIKGSPVLSERASFEQLNGFDQTPVSTSF